MKVGHHKVKDICALPKARKTALKHSKPGRVAPIGRSLTWANMLKPPLRMYTLSTPFWKKFAAAGPAMRSSSSYRMMARPSLLE